MAWSIETKQDRECPICQGQMKKLIDLMRYPLTEMYEPYTDGPFRARGYVDQGFLFCERCSHGKLETVVSPSFLYSNYVTSTSRSIGSRRAVERFHRYISDRLDVDQFNTVVDIGANDATLLKRFAAPSKKLVAIDPNAGKYIPSDSGIQVLSDFAENIDLSHLGSGRTLTISSHTLEHIERPGTLLEQLRRASDDNDMHVFQFPSLELLLRDARFDQVHHQHIHYFSKRSASLLLAKHGFEPVDSCFDSEHYGALMLIFRKSTGGRTPGFGTPLTVDSIIERKRIFDLNMAASDERVDKNTNALIAFGAALMLPILVYYIPALSKVAYIVDDDQTKHGLRFINFNKRIVDAGKANLTGKDVIITAVSTKLAMRLILRKLLDADVENILLPMNQI